MFLSGKKLFIYRMKQIGNFISATIMVFAVVAILMFIGIAF